MTALAWLFLAAAILLAALLTIALAGDADLAERLRKALGRADHEKRLRLEAEQRNEILIDDLDFAVVEAAVLRDRVTELEREALPKAPNWGAAPAEWRVVS